MADLREERERVEEVEGGSLEDLRHLSDITVNEGQPIQYEEGFTLRSVMGALFVTFVMLPAGIYLGLVVGTGLGAAAEWVTILLFSEVARRSFAPLKRQEIYLLYIMAASLTSMAGHGIAGGPFGGYIWNVYFRSSSAAQAFGLSDKIPTWVVPPADSPAILNRTFWHRDWLLPIGLLVIGNILGVLNTYGLGYALFRITSDMERLPFPMAPVNAGGATALAEAGSKEESWRWRVFSIGAMIGIVWAFFHTAIPIFTGAVLLQPLQIIPIPFLDLTPNTEAFLPGAQMGIDINLGVVLGAFVVPYQVVIGSSVGALLSQIVVAPILQKHGFFPMWRPGMSAIYTNMVTNMDFWMSLGIGIGVAIGLIGIYEVVKSVIQARRQQRNQVRTRRRFSLEPPPGRGDIPLWLSLLFWFSTTTISLIITHKLVPGFPVWILMLFAYLYTPIVSYVSARMIGLTTRGIGFPFLREAVIIKSGYRGLDIWYANLHMADYGPSAQWFREIELTGTKFTSILKMNLFITPLILFSSFIFWSYFWKTNVIPSAQFPYAQKFWPLQATTEAIWKTANMGEGSIFMKAIKPPVIYFGGIMAIVLYIITVVTKIPVLYYYGFMGSIGGLPTGAIPSLVGALLGRYYFAKKIGEANWRKYTPVLLAGFTCGGGLISMAAIALALIIKVTNFLPF